MPQSDQSRSLISFTAERFNETPKSSMNVQPMRIMVVDDEDFIRSLLQEVLRTLGHEVVVFGETQAAITAFQAANEKGLRFDVVILDLRLEGGMNGVTLLHELRKFDPCVKALAISGRVEEEATVPLGFQGFLSKPFRIKAFAEALAAVAGDSAPLT